ncbi:MAG: UDP-N-acetylmuramoyl-L-alanyl-D-glutamate--2,6-diaminopimelate ligase [Planctomycetota bacterium]
MRLKALLAGTGLSEEGSCDPPITGLSADSRRIEVGDLFIAVRGSAVDGGDFIEDALSRGAAAVVAAGDRPEGWPVEVAFVSLGSASQVSPDQGEPGLTDRCAYAELAANFWGRPSERLTLVGVTGTNGKTTTASLIESILESAWGGCGLLGTVRSSTGKTSRASSMTTPAPEYLQAALAEMVAAGLPAVVMEVSSHALDQDRVAALSFDLAVYTSLGRDHLDYHGSLEAYAAAKAKLVGGIVSGGALVLNEDDVVFRGLASQRDPTVRLLCYSARGQDGVDLGVEVVETSIAGSRFRLCVGSLEPGRQDAHCSLFGEHNIENILAASAAGLALGLTLEEVATGLERFPGVPGRMETLRMAADYGFEVVVDYMHTPDAYARVIAGLREMLAKTQGRLILVFGCGGDRDSGKRPQMGRLAAAGADLVFFTADNPRGETLDAIAKDVEAGVEAGESRAQWCRIDDRREAIWAALDAARANDICLLAGKGHETFQVLGSKTLDWDDRAVVAEWAQRKDKPAGS